MKYAIKTKELSIAFGRSIALHKISLDIPKGAVFGLLGSNGAGKTTLISALSEIYKPSFGEILMSSKNIGVMPQRAQFPLDKTPLQFLTYLGMLKGLTHEQAHRQTASLLDRFGLDAEMDCKFDVLSHGKLKLVNIAQAFLGNPEIVLLDEPIAGLDPKMRVRMVEFLKEEHKKRTFVLCSHHLGVIEKLCTHIAVLHDGQIMIDGELEKIRDQKHLLYVKLSHVSEKMITALNKIKGVTCLFVDYNSNTIRIKQQKESFDDIYKMIRKFKVDLLYVKRGEKLDDFFLKYL